MAIASQFLERDNSEISLQLEQNQKLSASNVETLTGDTLIESRLIERVSISGSNYKTSPPCSISINLQLLYDPIGLRISGDRARCTIARDEILEVLSSRRQWYSVFYSRFFGAIAPLSIGIILGLALGAVGDISWNGPQFLRVASATAICLFFLYWSRRLLFPKMQFDFGKSGRRLAATEKWRSFVFIAVMTGLIVGVAASLVAAVLAR